MAYFSSTSIYITIVKKLHFCTKTVKHNLFTPEAIRYVIMRSFNDNNTQVNQNYNYNVSNRVKNSNTKNVPLFRPPCRISVHVTFPDNDCKQPRSLDFQYRKLTLEGNNFHKKTHIFGSSLIQNSVCVQQTVS